MNESEEKQTMMRYHNPLYTAILLFTHPFCCCLKHKNT